MMEYKVQTQGEANSEYWRDYPNNGSYYNTIEVAEAVRKSLNDLADAHNIPRYTSRIVEREISDWVVIRS